MSFGSGNFCAVDLGSHKVTVAIGQRAESSGIKILGVSQKKSKGIKQGSVINLEMAMETLNAALDEAKSIAGVDIKEVTLGVSAPSISGFNSYGLAAVENGEVSIEDLAMAIKTAKAVPMSADTEMLHVLQRDYIVDGQPGVTEPIGMFAVRLESNVHIIVASSRLLQNVRKCVSNCGYKISNLVVEHLAASSATLTENEKEMGVCLVNLGADSTSFSVFADGGICYTSSITTGGSSISSDISKVFRLPVEAAESLKLQYGYAASKYLKNPDEKIDIPNSLGNAKKRISLQDLSLVIEARVEEIFEALYRELDKNRLLEVISSGIVFTGGGAKLKGLARLAEDMFKLPVRVGGPIEVTGANEVVHNPSYSTVVGLLKYASEHNYESQDQSIDDDMMEIEEKSDKSKKKLVSSVKGWFANNF
ncbi:cell division protein FtsA [Candidatus Francisella endociliophora]|uniref:Cell division protein FtsA n=1 Tax=Candidatus Francisella endociliophora TaxID=653937 RepID=A0A097EQ90_9GAMM|nr:cell division protein FtsA [Francisella sp. FSC1006]AIT09738.1 cell division protein FtsA [Francisella sp. FSC1006]